MKTRIKEYTIFFMIVALCFCDIIKAQVKHEISAYGGGGLSTLHYSNSGDNDLGKKTGYSFGLGYSCFFTEKWSVNTGVELSQYRARTELFNLSGAYPTMDDEGQNFEYRYRINWYTESQRAMYLSIPLMIQFQTKEDNSFYVALGGKIGIPVDSKYKSVLSGIATQGYYPSTNVVYDDLLFRGFGKYRKKRHQDDLDIKTAFMLSGELGYKSRLSESLRLYTGVYAGYGLNNIVKEGEEFMPYDSSNPDSFNNNSVTDKMKPLTIGVKFKLAFQL